MLLEHLQHAEVRKSARKTAAQGQTDAWPEGRRCPFEQSELVILRHE